MAKATLFEDSLVERWNVDDRGRGRCWFNRCGIRISAPVTVAQIHPHYRLHVASGACPDPVLTCKIEFNSGGKKTRLHLAYYNVYTII